MKKTFHLATVFNIPIEVNYTWFIILGLVVFSLARGYFPMTNPEVDPYAHWIMAFFAAVLLFASLLAHELSHSLVARSNDLPISGITLFVFGGVAHLEKEPSSPAVEFKMAIAGPLMSFTLAAVFFLATALLDRLGYPSFVLSITGYLFVLNLVVGTFNLIPGFPLDGGRVLRAALWHYLRDLRRATAIASALGKGFALCLIGVGLFYLFSGQLIGGVWFIFIGLFLHEAADSSYRQLTMEKVFSRARVDNVITRNVITVPAGLTLDRLIEDYFFRYRHHSFPVVANDQVLGLLTLHLVKEVPREQWGQTRAEQAMLSLTDSLVINERADLKSALTKLAGNGLGRLLVIERGKLTGIISQKDIIGLFDLQNELGG